MGAAADRRYPRVPIDKQAALDFRVPRKGRGEPELVRIPVAIRSISCEGVGLALCDQRFPLTTGTTVTLYFVVDGQRFEIPGRVVWLAGKHLVTPAMDAGVHFQLGLAGTTVRQSYATWIVDLIMQHQRPRARVATHGGPAAPTSGRPTAPQPAASMPPRPAASMPPRPAALPVARLPALPGGSAAGRTIAPAGRPGELVVRRPPGKPGAG